MSLIKSLIHQCPYALCLLDDAGGAQTNGIFGGEDNFDYLESKLSVPIKVEVRRSENILVSSVPAFVTDEIDGLILGYQPLKSMAEIHIENETMVLAHPKLHLMSSKSVDWLLANAVLILGDDKDSALANLRMIETAVLTSGYEGWILKDYFDLPEQDLDHKLMTMASTSAFIIIDDSRPTGHLSEMRQIAQSIPTPIAILRKKGEASSWMIDPLLNLQNVRQFSYSADNPTHVFQAARQACHWALESRGKKAAFLDRHYPWREKEILMQNIVNDER